MTSANLFPHAEDKVSALSRSLHDHWRLYIAEGVVLVVLGSAAIIVPPLASLAIASFLGWLFLIGGSFGLAMTLAGRQAPGFWWSLLSSAVTIAVGALLVVWPAGGVVSLTFVLTAFLVVNGLLIILFAAEHRRLLSQRWGWLLVNGLLDLALAALIVWALPGSAVWALGLIIGVDMLFGGVSLIALALAAHEKTLPGA